VVGDFALQDADFRHHDLTGVDAGLELGHEAIKFVVVVSTFSECRVEIVEDVDTVVVAEAWLHFPGQDSLVSHILINFYLVGDRAFRQIAKTILVESAVESAPRAVSWVNASR